MCETSSFEKLLLLTERKESNEFKENELGVSVTSDNYFKISMIYRSVLANIPIILSGHTGIGKTQLVNLLSKCMNKHLAVFNIHAGIT